MSEPDFRIGVDEEMVSSLESLHEDLYFVTLDFFDALGRTTTQAPARRAREDLPDHPSRNGRAGRARCTCSTPATRRTQAASSKSRYTEKGVEKPDDRCSRELGKIDTTPPQALRAVVRADGDQRDRAAGRREGRSRSRTRRRCARRLIAVCTRRVSSRPTLSYDHVDRVAVAIALKDVAHAPRRRRAPARRRPPTCARAAAKPKLAARHVGSRHQPRRVRGDRRQAGGVPGDQGLQGRASRTAAATSR